MNRILVTEDKNYKEENVELFCSGSVQIVRSNSLSEIVKEIFRSNTKILVTKTFKHKYRFVSLLILLLGKKYTWADDIRMLINEQENYDVIYIPHNRLLNSIIGYHLQTLTDIKSRIYTIPLERNKFYQKLISNIYEILFKFKLKNAHSYAPLIICGNCADLNFLKMLRASYPRSVIINRFYDDLSEDVLINIGKLDTFNKSLKKINVSIETYNKDLAKSNNLKYQPNYVSFNNSSKLDNSNTVVFIGSSQNRFDQLYGIAKILYKHGYRIEFLFSNQVDKNQLEKIDRFNTMAGYQAFKCSQFLTYSDYYDKILKSAIIIDLYRIYPTEGYSYRIGEALSMNKSLITNRVNIVDESFYSIDKICVFSDDISVVDEFLDKKHNSRLLYKDTDEFNIDVYIKNKLIDSNKS
ncbi:Uncharacterised protein [Anaerobiospirillum thomasii]|uniref:hypothetical protein n=1 Tax=Anaerobiospirillum thomasii TaxID=179995 RepID=UPI000D812FAC|nr:hypothetical protein [Anaerobiospirillum thomasii]SPT68677.1 Uncharacterised protein [Anaerobiospirillum thomasii]